MKPDRHGFTWSGYEQMQVLNEYYKGIPLQRIANKHKRSLRAIEFFLHKKIQRELNDIIINNINFTQAFDVARKIVHSKIHLDVILNGGEIK